MTAAAVVAYPPEWDDLVEPGKGGRDHAAEWQRAKPKRASEYRRRRRRLIEVLGGECYLCGEDDADELEFDHPNGRTWEPRRCNQLIRIRRYEADAAAGNLRLLCHSCNSFDGGANALRYAEIKRRAAR